MEQQYKGRVLLGAPTGMAAVNIEGKTLHSLCSLPSTWILKGDIKYLPTRTEIRQAELLIIDEVSMVTANVLDGVSAFLKKNRENSSPFGGLPVVLVGYLFQLPPVVTDRERDMFNRYYHGFSRFYNARCLQNVTYYPIELDKTYRQTDSGFVALLSNIREGRNLSATVEMLNSLCPITRKPPMGAVWLSPRNYEVNRRNADELAKLLTPAQSYKGIIEGTLKSDRMPSPLDLVLKVGAQVVFTKNDRNKRWVNGTVGLVAELEAESLVVEIIDSGFRVIVERVSWEDYRYQWNPTTGEIERVVTGRYTQFPLSLGWAMTIHKSQGQTIECIHVDFGDGVFDTGQAYVALSRCRSAQGLTLARPLKISDILVDADANRFYDRIRELRKALPPEALWAKLKPGEPWGQRRAIA
jgi:hypothetical protein